MSCADSPRSNQLKRLNETLSSHIPKYIEKIKRSEIIITARLHYILLFFYYL